MKLPRAALVLVLSALLCACQGVQVGYDLDQTEANRIVSVLNANGISAMARKESGSRGKLGIFVDRGSYTQAVTVLNAKGLPAEAQLSFAETVATQGLLPGSREMEKLKLDHALALELETLLENDPQIASAKVIVRQNFLKDGDPPSISAVIEARGNRPSSMDEISSLIQRAVPGVSPDRVSVSMRESQEEKPITEQMGVVNSDGKPMLLSLASFLVFWRVPKDDYVSFACTLAGLLVLCLCVGSIVGYWYGYYIQSKHFFEQSPSEMVPKVTRMDMRRERLQQIDLTGSGWTRND